jgi:hypothetical protein
MAAFMAAFMAVAAEASVQVGVRSIQCFYSCVRWRPWWQRQLRPGDPCWPCELLLQFRTDCAGGGGGGWRWWPRRTCTGQVMLCIAAHTAGLKVILHSRFAIIMQVAAVAGGAGGVRRTPTGRCVTGVTTRCAGGPGPWQQHWQVGSAVVVCHNKLVSYHCYHNDDSSQAVACMPWPGAVLERKEEAALRQDVCTYSAHPKPAQDWQQCFN